MRAFVKIFTTCLLVAFLASCVTPAATNPPVAEPTKPADTAVPKPADTAVPKPADTTAPKPTDTTAPVTLTPAEEWAKANEVGPYQPATQDWAAIEAAALKEGKLVVYANSSRIEDEITLFQAKYPGIVLDGQDADEIDVKMSEEQKAGNVIGDMWFNSDGYILFGTFVPNQWLWSFVPDSVVMPEVTKDQPFAIERHGVDVIGYNTELNPKGCPVNNWWQLTEPAYKGKVFMEDPIANVSMTAIITTIAQHADEMAVAYKDLYGKEWNTDSAYGTDTRDAAWLWIKKMAQNSPGIQPGGDEVVQAFATPGMKADAGVGIAGYSKYRDTLKGELVFDVCKGMKPSLGFFKSTYLAIATGSKHPNAAKLFIKFVLSDEGRQPWNVIGDYPAVKGQVPPEGAIPLDQLNVWTMDDMYIYKNVSEVRDFWALNLLGN